MSKETKWTPGPWVFGEQNGHFGISVGPPCRVNVATVYLGLVTSEFNRGAEHFALKENKESVANAHLISAAPELYEALDSISRRLQVDIDDGGRPDQWSMEALVRIASNVMAKARGES